MEITLFLQSAFKLLFFFLMFVIQFFQFGLVELVFLNFFAFKLINDLVIFLNNLFLQSFKLFFLVLQLLFFLLFHLSELLFSFLFYLLLNLFFLLHFFLHFSDFGFHRFTNNILHQARLRLLLSDLLDLLLLFIYLILEKLFLLVD